MSKKGQIIAFLLLCGGILFSINEKLIQFYSAFWLEIKFLTIPALIIVIPVHRKKISNDKISVFKQTLSVILMVFIISFPYVLIANKYLASPSEFTVKGKILNAKPGRGTGEQRLREVTAELENGEIINFSIQHRIFNSVTSGNTIDFKCQIGALGLLYLL